MKFLVVVVGAALLLPVAARAETTVHPQLSRIASYVAQRQVTVECGPISDPLHTRAAATTWIDERLTILTPMVCGTLDRRMRGQNPRQLDELAWAMLTFTHEAVHQRGIRDEGETECAALKLVPRVATLFFRFKTWRSRHDLMDAVWRQHRRTPLDYQRLC